MSLVNTSVILHFRLNPFQIRSTCWLDMCITSGPQNKSTKKSKIQHKRSQLLTPKKKATRFAFKKAAKKWPSQIHSEQQASLIHSRPLLMSPLWPQSSDLTNDITPDLTNSILTLKATFLVYIRDIPLTSAVLVKQKNFIFTTAFISSENMVIKEWDSTSCKLFNQKFNYLLKVVTDDKKYDKRIWRYMGIAKDKY